MHSVRRRHEPGLKYVFLIVAFGLILSFIINGDWPLRDLNKMTNSVSNAIQQLLYGRAGYGAGIQAVPPATLHLLSLMVMLSLVALAFCLIFFVSNIPTPQRPWDYDSYEEWLLAGEDTSGSSTT